MEERDAYEESLKSYRDNLNIIDTAREEGREEAKMEMVKALLDVLEDEVIAEKTGISVEKIASIRMNQ